MKIRFLGTGTSTGNPEIGCRCEVCQSKDKRDWRLRASILVETNSRNILIDCGPDFRWQMIKSGVTSLDAVLITHEHYDHVGGLDDLRPFGKLKDVDVFAEEYVAEAIRSRIPYAFPKRKYPGIPNINLHPIENAPFRVEGILITPIRLMHGRLPILGYRIGNMAYLTDIKSIPEEEYEKLQDLEILIIDALREEEHVSHQNIHQAFEQIERIKPRRTYLTHMSHHFGLHAEKERQMPDRVFISYDGLEITSA